jgi:hypothetical protein
MAAQALPASQHPAIGRPVEVYLHLHGVTAEEIAALMHQRHGS